MKGKKVDNKTEDWEVIEGDCLDVINDDGIKPESVSLIFTSPPYADQRRSTYGGVHPNDYVDWFLPRSEAMQGVLTPDGSFVLNIKEKAINGERHRYVTELILAIRDQGWRLVDEYIWHKKNSYPGKWPNRFRDAWERLLHFTLSPKFKMRQESVMVTAGDATKPKLHRLSDTDFNRDESQTGSKFGIRLRNWVGRDMAYPTNVLHIATETRNKGHPAAFPIALPSWFIKLFTDTGDIVLDPFAGSGTTLVAALDLGRRAVGIDIFPEYCDLMIERIHTTQPQLQQ